MTSLWKRRSFSYVIGKGGVRGGGRGEGVSSPGSTTDKRWSLGTAMVAGSPNTHRAAPLLSSPLNPAKPGAPFLTCLPKGASYLSSVTGTFLHRVEDLHLGGNGNFCQEVLKKLTLKHKSSRGRKLTGRLWGKSEVDLYLFF